MLRVIKTCNSLSNYENILSQTTVVTTQVRPTRRKTKWLVFRRIGRRWNSTARTETARTSRIHVGHRRAQRRHVLGTPGKCVPFIHGSRTVAPVCTQYVGRLWRNTSHFVSPRTSANRRGHGTR